MHINHDRNLIFWKIVHLTKFVPAGLKSPAINLQIFICPVSSCNVLMDKTSENEHLFHSHDNEPRAPSRQWTLKSHDDGQDTA